MCVVGTAKPLGGFQPLQPSQNCCSSSLGTLFVCSVAKYLTMNVCCVTLKAMKMSRRSADASQRALAYSRMVDGLNEFRSVTASVTQKIIKHLFVLSLFISQGSQKCKPHCQFVAQECQGNLISFIWLNFVAEVLLPCCAGIHKGSITSAFLHRTKAAKKSHSHQAHSTSQDKQVNCSVYLGQTATLCLGEQQSGNQFLGNGA